jgi:hypothetical protein
MVEKAQDAKSEHSISGTSYNPAHPSTSSSTGLGETRGEPSTSASPTRREIFDATLAGKRDHVLLPHLRSDPPPSKTYQRLAHSLTDFRQQEGDQREARLREIWLRLTEARSGKGGIARAATITPVGSTTASSAGTEASVFTREKAERLQDIYDDELLHRCGNSPRLAHARGPKPLIPWKVFYRYAEAKEVGESSAISNFGPFSYLIGISLRVVAGISR